MILEKYFNMKPEEFTARTTIDMLVELGILNEKYLGKYNDFFNNSYIHYTSQGIVKIDLNCIFFNSIDSMYYGIWTMIGREKNSLEDIEWNNINIEKTWHAVKKDKDYYFQCMCDKDIKEESEKEENAKKEGKEIETIVYDENTEQPKSIPIEGGYNLEKGEDGDLYYTGTTGKKFDECDSLAIIRTLYDK
jgi:hypothetical protein